MADHLFTSRFNCEAGTSVTSQKLYGEILPLARLWAANINHIKWNNRLQWDNHHPFFPFFHTVMWDSTPFFIQQARHWQTARMNNNGHYPGNCYLVLVGITFKGEIVYASELSRATSRDSALFMQSRALHPQNSWEMNIGDSHFDVCPHFDTPPQRHGGRHLTVLESVYYNMIQLPRSRIETMNHVIKSHAMFKQTYRGYVENLSVFVKISMHAAALVIRTNREHGSFRYQGFGW
eukprot:CAMPEP_0114354694 /NCGR_PEP_ID=MMETSP0101-20121206/19677_1 /TAXON_ID=38822 ORGANISM="Pteridomonas danica, Strain PT" /NCGR_SAMPLE_ID=MMETSP0101 /ASSEMBLY_ACC=CAM_ASM_000211 /LENGTH=234 /DNA_ID=CAMNT_0001496301 /DNA_START=225 /DNA_END=926 /DNA_ORIENTATION=+